MSERTRRQIELAAVVVALCSGVAGLAGAWVVIPYRVAALEEGQRRTESAMAALVAKSAGDRELLVRIEEKLIALTKKFEDNQNVAGRPAIRMKNSE